MNLEQSFFLECLSDFINDRRTIVKDVKMDVIIKYAKQHECAGILYYQTQVEELKNEMMLCTYYAVQRHSVIQKIHDEFINKKIPYAIFKGYEVSKYYPIPALRTMGDIDLLVDLDKKDEAKFALEHVGCVCNKKTNFEWYFQKDKIQIELHHGLVYDKIVTEKKIKSFCEKVWESSKSEDGIEHILNKEYHFVFLIIHLRKHLLNCGVGFRQFIDIALKWVIANEW